MKPIILGNENKFKILVTAYADKGHIHRENLVKKVNEPVNYEN